MKQRQSVFLFLALASACSQAAKVQDNKQLQKEEPSTVLQPTPLSTLGASPTPVTTVTSDASPPPQDKPDEKNAFFVAPEGSGTTCTQKAPCKLDVAKTAVRTLTSKMQSDISVYLFGGVYLFDKTISFDENDSGQNGHFVIWKNYDQTLPEFSGQIKLGPWSASESGSNMVQTQLPVGLNSRQFYVNETRSIRPMGIINPGWSADESGIATGALDYSYLKNHTQLEVVAFREWKSYRCPVQSVGKARIAMQMPCWQQAFNSGAKSCHAGWGIRESNGISWIENAKEFMRNPGDWYLNNQSGVLFYLPKSGDNLATAIVPALEKLIVINNAHHMKFSGIRFTNTGWTEPNSGNGYVELQAGAHHVENCVTDLPPASVEVVASSNIFFTRNLFARSGSSGLKVSQSNTVTIEGNVFSDISASGLIAGDTNLSSAKETYGISIRNNYFKNTAREYFGTPAVFIGVARESTFAHNEIDGTYYSGISMGWGWSAPSYSKNNSILFNRIHNVLKGPLRDGGAIYTNMNAPNSEIRGNYLYDVGFDQQTIYTIYLDAATGITVSENASEVDGSKSTARWMRINGGGNTISKNYSTQSVGDYCGVNSEPACLNGTNSFANNIFWPTPYPAWMQLLKLEGCSDNSNTCAGIEQSFQSIKDLRR